MRLLNVFILLSVPYVLLGCSTGKTEFFTFQPSNARSGSYGKTDLSRDWNNPKWENGITQGLVSIVEVNDPNRSRALKVLFPKGSYSNSSIPGKIQWVLDFAKGLNEVYFAYDIKFDSNFNFVKGGKLHGLAGGKRNTGGKKPDGLDGWSSRVIWLSQGKLGQYVYNPDQPTNYGQIFKYTANGEDIVAKQGKWYRIINRVVMNTPRKHDGIVQAWVNGELVLDIRDLRFRDTDAMSIDSFLFSTFFGGDDETWAAAKDESIYFDNFLISTSPLAHP
ncbi:MAG: hypothetical protein A4E63_03044 [Syntrophorhabdus sp. PtaU1.Bin050]|nr:MAG: hypothetical protein A4E63_03044 [Syntrophorhabdus sp. PtaU1.Bin050]